MRGAGIPAGARGSAGSLFRDWTASRVGAVELPAFGASCWRAFSSPFSSSLFVLTHCSQVHARLLRLHRPFLSRGYNPGSPFRYSTDQCIRAAGYIIATNYELLRVTSSLWWSTFAPLCWGIALILPRSVHRHARFFYRAHDGPLSRH